MEEGPVEYHLDQVIEKLKGASKEQIAVFNQWAAVGLNQYHPDSVANFDLIIHGETIKASIKWNSEFPQYAMREKKHIAEDGGVSMAFFIMSVLLDYKYVIQSEIGEGVDYSFHKLAPEDDNFYKECHYIEISGILEQNDTNTIDKRIREKHNQIKRGSRNNGSSSVIVTLFQKPLSIKEIHNEGN